MKRNRNVYFVFIILTILIGLFSRMDIISDWINSHVGDFLYAVLFFLIFGFIFNQTKSYKIAFFALLFCYGIEFLQLYQADWINFIRSYKVTKLVLGNDFKWEDIISYTFGVGVIYVLEMVWIQKAKIYK